MTDHASHEQLVAAVVHQAKQSLGEILDQSGCILYSSPATLEAWEYYFHGLNPGGLDSGTRNIGECLANLGEFTTNAYLMWWT